MQNVHIELPNGTGVKVLDNEVIEQMHQLGSLDIMTNNFVYADAVYSLYLGKRTGTIFGLKRFLLGDSREVMEGYWTKEMIELAAANRVFLPADSGYRTFADLDGSEARRFLESKGFDVVENRDTGRNGVAITACGIYLSTNGYIHK